MKSITLKFLLLLTIASSCDRTEFIDNMPQMEITVLDVNGERVSGVTIYIFESEDNWSSQVNPIQTKDTNAQGNVLFENLHENIYYFYAEKNDKTNIESISALEKELQKNVKAKITTIIK